MSIETNSLRHAYIYICMISKNIKEYNIYSLLYTEIGIIHLTPIFPVIPSHYLQVICAPRNNIRRFLYNI